MREKLEINRDQNASAANAGESNLYQLVFEPIKSHLELANLLIFPLVAPPYVTIFTTPRILFLSEL